MSISLERGQDRTMCHNTFARTARVLTLVTAASLMLTACGMGGGHRRGQDGTVQPTARELDPAGTHYSDTMDAAANGDCSDQTVSILTCYAYRGHGYEGAQTALGQCLIKNKNTKEGMTWLQRAGDAGWPDAQKALAQAYLDGKNVDADPVEAGKWVLLYKKNPSLLSLGVTPDQSIADKVVAALNDSGKTEAIARANAWQAKFWSPQTALEGKAAAACYVAPRRVYTKPDIDVGPDTTE